MEHTPASESGTESKRWIQIRVPDRTPQHPRRFERATTIAVVFKMPGIRNGALFDEGGGCTDRETAGAATASASGAANRTFAYKNAFPGKVPLVFSRPDADIDLHRNQSLQAQCFDEGRRIPRAARRRKRAISYGHLSNDAKFSLATERHYERRNRHRSGIPKAAWTNSAIGMATNS